METIKNATDKVTDKVANLGSSNLNKTEGATTKAVEQVTAAAPSIIWLALAGGAVATSLTLKLMGKDKTANFVGQWVPTILLLGIYNKIVKVMGSERRGY